MNKTETDPNLIADEFGKYFSGIGKQFAEAIPQPNHSPEYYRREHPTDPGEIAKIFRSCKSKKVLAMMELIVINITHLKQTYQGCSLPMYIIVNRSIETGQVHDAVKLAKVIPIYKAKSKESLGNYRP